ncbi:hypothetical protein SLS57_004508 [Botryosphaeria dothidea]
MDTEAAAFAFNPYPGTQTVHLSVGPDQLTLSANEDLLREHCSFVDYALTDHWHDSTEEPFELPDDDPDAVAGLLWWIHEGNFRHPDTLENFPSFHITHMIKIWTIAEKYSVPLLQECMVRLVLLTYMQFDEPKDFPMDLSILEYLSESTAEDNHIRQLYLVFIAYSRPAVDSGNGRKVLLPFDEEDKDNMPSEILEELNHWMDARVRKGNTLGWTPATDMPNEVLLASLLSSLDAKRRKILEFLFADAVERPLQG